MSQQEPLSLDDGSAIMGVLDIDSPLMDRFTRDDVQYVESLAREFCALPFGQVG